MRTAGVSGPRWASSRGFTLLEALVATLIMAIAVVGLLSNISTSLGNASRLSDYDMASLLATRKMEELYGAPVVAGQTLGGKFLPAETGGLDAGWLAVVQPFERAGQGGGGAVLDRLALEVWWMRDGRRRTFQLETFRVRRPQRPEEYGQYPHR